MLPPCSVLVLIILNLLLHLFFPLLELIVLLVALSFAAFCTISRLPVVPGAVRSARVPCVSCYWSSTVQKSNNKRWNFFFMSLFFNLNANSVFV